MSSASKRKGYSFEVECIHIAESLGFTTKRAWGSNGRAMGEHEEVDILIGGEKYQCKRRAKIAQDLFPNEEVVEGQIIRADRQKHPYIVLPLPVFLKKYKRAYDRLEQQIKDSVDAARQAAEAEYTARQSALHSQNAGETMR